MISKNLYTLCCVALVAAVASLWSCGSKPKEKDVVLNEICGKDVDNLDWIELGNAGSKPVNLTGYKIRKVDEEGLEKKLYTFPDTTLAPGELYMVNVEDLKGRISHKKSVAIELYDSKGNLVEVFDCEEDIGVEKHPKGHSYARYPDLTGEWVVSTRATWNEPNVNAERPVQADEAETGSSM